MIKSSLIFFFFCLLLIGCSQSTKKTEPVAPRDTTITKANSFSELFFDSTVMEKFLAADTMNDSLKNNIRSFYNNRNYQFAWFFSDSLADYTSTFIDMQNDYIGYSGDSSLYNRPLQQWIDTISNGYPVSASDSNIIKTELMLTQQFYNYADRAYQGRTNISAKDLNWFIPRKKIDATAMLDSLISNKGKHVAEYEPVNRQYNLLKGFLEKYYSIQKNGGWPIIKADKKLYKEGDSSAVITQIKRRLFLDGDLMQQDTATIFTPDLQAAVKSFQHRYGLTEDGVIGLQVINEMNVPVDQRIQQMLENMERIRWMPAQPTTDYLVVNIPEFRLHVYENGKYLWSMKVVVGSTVHNTVIFTGTLKYIVFSPYWNIPQSIIKNEILPAMQRNKNYLAAHNMEWNGGAVRQKPGPDNSLGLVKFLFPNSYNIYLHDTPAKSLFGESKRAFSHGCIRLAEPKKLAQFLLRNDPKWDSVKITKAMNLGKEQYVTLTDNVPVFIGYFTAWVDRNNQLNFRDDIYGHDKKMAQHLFTSR